MQMPLVKKCYHCKVIEDLTNTQLAALEQEYSNLQHYLQTREDIEVYIRLTNSSRQILQKDKQNKQISFVDS